MSGSYNFPAVTPDEARVREIVREETSLVREQLAEHSTKLRALVDALLNYLSASEERRRASLQAADDPEHPEQQHSVPDLRGGSVESEALHLLREAGILGDRNVAEIHDVSPSFDGDAPSVGDDASAPGLPDPGAGCGNDAIRVGATVKALREAYGWRLGKFAVAIGTTHAHLSNIEAGRRRCTPEISRKIADTLGVPLAAITTARPIESVT